MTGCSARATRHQCGGPGGATGSRRIKVAHNFPRSVFKRRSKRCNSNDTNSKFEAAAGELRATLPRNHACDRPRGPDKTRPGNAPHEPPVWRAPAGPQGLAGLRADAPSKARGADGERAGGPDGARNTDGTTSNNKTGPQALAVQRAPRATSAEGAVRASQAPATTHHQCGGCRQVRRAWPGFEPTRRAKLAARTVSGRAGPTAPGTPVAQPTEQRWHNQQKHRRHNQQQQDGPAGPDHATHTTHRTPPVRKALATPGTPVARPARTPAARQARRRACASGPLHKPHLSLIRSSQVRRSPTRMPKSRFWSAIAASVAGFLMRAARTSGAAVMAPTP